MKITSEACLNSLISAASMPLKSEFWPCDLYSFAKAAMTKCHHLRGPWSFIYLLWSIFPPFWRLEVRNKGVLRVGFFWRLSSWLVDSGLFTENTFPRTVTLWGTRCRTSTYECGGGTIQPLTGPKSVFNLHSQVIPMCSQFWVSALSRILKPCCIRITWVALKSEKHLLGITFKYFIWSMWDGILFFSQMI